MALRASAINLGGYLAVVRWEVAVALWRMVLTTNDTVELTFQPSPDGVPQACGSGPAVLASSVLDFVCRASHAGDRIVVPDGRVFFKQVGPSSAVAQMLS